MDGKMVAFFRFSESYDQNQKVTIICTATTIIKQHHHRRRQQQPQRIY